MDKVMVCLKRVVDYNVRIRVKQDNSGIVTEGVKMSINPLDEIALEEALRIREQGKADEIIVVSIGSGDCQQQLRTGSVTAVNGEIDALVLHRGTGGMAVAGTGLVWTERSAHHKLRMGTD